MFVSNLFSSNHITSHTNAETANNRLMWTQSYNMELIKYLIDNVTASKNDSCDVWLTKTHYFSLYLPLANYILPFVLKCEYAVHWDNVIHINFHVLAQYQLAQIQPIMDTGTIYFTYNIFYNILQLLLTIWAEIWICCPMNLMRDNVIHINIKLWRNISL